MVIQITDVSKKYYPETDSLLDKLRGDETAEQHSVSALDGISLSVEQGEFCALLGKNGAGKTTLINVLTGQIEPDTGTVQVFGKSAVEFGSEIREDVGILPEQEVPPDFLTPRDYFNFVGDVRGISPDEIATRVDNWAEKLQFEDKLDTLNRNLSRGQQQKVMLTAAFIHRPELVFIDEPLANLDPFVQERVKDFLKQYHADGNTLILSTHYTEAAEELCDRIAIVSDGSITKRMPIENLAESEDLSNLIINSSHRE